MSDDVIRYFKRDFARVTEQEINIRDEMRCDKLFSKLN